MAVSLTLHNLLNFEVGGLSNIVRYNTRSRLKDESVAEHSYYVAYYVMVLCDFLRVSQDTRVKALEYAIIHDIPEIGTGDIPYDVKKESPQLKELLVGLEGAYIANKFPSLTHRFHSLVQEKSDAHDILHLADMMSVVRYTKEEESLGNNSISDVRKDAEKICEEMLLILIRRLGPYEGMIDAQKDLILKMYIIENGELTQESLDSFFRNPQAKILLGELSLEEINEEGTKLHRELEEKMDEEFAKREVISSENASKLHGKLLKFHDAVDMDKLDENIQLTKDRLDKRREEYKNREDK